MLPCDREQQSDQLSITARDPTPLIRQPGRRRVGPVLIHFTSLANYNQVRDVVSNLLGTSWSTTPVSYAHAEVMVIPKPVGPRRFLTALHTAVNQPLVDPFFSPIATSPRSPGIGPYFVSSRRAAGGDTSHERGFFDSVPEESEAQIPRRASQSEPSAQANPPLSRLPSVSAQVIRTENGLHLSLPTPSDVIATPASEYFSTIKPGSSGSSAVVIQSPDGRPFGDVLRTSC